MSVAEPVVGVVLAGGQARRMGGGDKCLLRLAGRSLLDRVLERLAPQVDIVVINANGDPARFGAFGRPVVADVVAGHVGPLAGVLTGLEWARVHAAKARFVATVPGDAPFVARDLVEQLRAARDGAEADIAIACGGGRRHPVFGLWPVRLADALRAALVIDGVRKVESWTEQFRVAYAELAPAPLDPFFNVNDRDDLGTAERQLSHAAAAGPR